MGKKKKRRKIKKNIIFILLFLILLSGAGLGYLVYRNIQDNKTSPYYLAAETPVLPLMDKDGVFREFVRGTKVDIKNKRVDVEGTEYCQFVLDDVTYYVKEETLEMNRDDCVREKTLYALRDHVLTDTYDGFRINDWVKKGSQLSVSGFHELGSDGTIDFYFVNDRGYISSKYAALEYYETGKDASIYRDAFYGEGGSPEAIDYYDKEAFTPKTQMPDIVKALYINAEAIVDADAFIEIARQTQGINAFVVDIKDCYIDTQLAYDSPVARQYAPSTYNIPNSYDSYRENVRKLKDAGYYLIGRITAFKDDSFALDNPDEALMYEGRLYNYGSVKWPSIYSRKMWEYNVALGLEAIEEMDFDEIQYDYVRLPEDVEDVDLRNTYDETRAQAVTSFLRYASEYLHAKGAYVSADVFGETSGSEDDAFSAFVSYYGQFWPAISNAADAVSSMPYPDHFSYYAYGIYEPWYEPGELMYSWGRATYFAQEKTYDKAKCRTWIMAQDSDPYEVYYGPDYLKAQIDGLKDAGVFDGYMTWNAASSLSKYRSYIDVLD
jgi:hypothetical protein